MSMECDTRLSMMALQENGRATAAPQRRRRARRARINVAPATTAAAMASFALTLFTRGA